MDITTIENATENEPKVQTGTSTEESDIDNSSPITIILASILGVMVVLVLFFLLLFFK